MWVPVIVRIMTPCGKATLGHQVQSPATRSHMLNYSIPVILLSGIFFFLFAISYLLLNICCPGFSAFRMGQRQCFQLIAATCCAVIIFGDNEVRHARHMVMIRPKDCSELQKIFLHFSISYQTDNIHPLPVSGVPLAGFQSLSPVTQRQLLFHVFLHVKRGIDWSGILNIHGVSFLHIGLT